MKHRTPLRYGIVALCAVASLMMATSAQAATIYTTSPVGEDVTAPPRELPCELTMDGADAHRIDGLNISAGGHWGVDCHNLGHGKIWEAADDLMFTQDVLITFTPTYCGDDCLYRQRSYDIGHSVVGPINFDAEPEDEAWQFKFVYWFCATVGELHPYLDVACTAQEQIRKLIDDGDPFVHHVLEGAETLCDLNLYEYCKSAGKVTFEVTQKISSLKKDGWKPIYGGLGKNAQGGCTDMTLPTGTHYRLECVQIYNVYLESYQPTYIIGNPDPPNTAAIVDTEPAEKTAEKCIEEKGKPACIEQSRRHAARLRMRGMPIASAAVG